MLFAPSNALPLRYPRITLCPPFRRWPDSPPTITFMAPPVSSAGVPILTVPSFKLPFNPGFEPAPALKPIAIVPVPLASELLPIATPL